MSALEKQLAEYREEQGEKIDQWYRDSEDWWPIPAGEDARSDAAQFFGGLADSLVKAGDSSKEQTRLIVESIRREHELAAATAAMLEQLLCMLSEDETDAPSSFPDHAPAEVGPNLSANERMKIAIEENHELVGMSASQWASSLKVAKSTVAGCEMWKTIRELRAEAKAMAEKRARSPATT